MSATSDFRSSASDSIPICSSRVMTVGPTPLSASKAVLSSDENGIVNSFFGDESTQVCPTLEGASIARRARFENLQGGRAASIQPIRQRFAPALGRKLGTPGKGNCATETVRACMKYLMQALDIYGARTRNRTGTPLRAGDFKSHASTSFAIRAVARCSRVGNI